MSWHAVTSTVLPSGASLLGGYSIAALVNRRAANKEAEAASRQARTADWEGFTGRIMERLDSVEERLTLAEATAKKYPVAIAYIRQLVEWVGQQLPGRKNMPTPPPELEADL